MESRAKPAVATMARSEADWGMERTDGSLKPKGNR
jgi:hypothetical protein